MKFKNLTPTPGFDSNDHYNSNQNNYAWAMVEFDEYIYVGTGQNILSNTLKILDDFGVKPPPALSPSEKSKSAEIWRCKKNPPSTWDRVFKTDALLAIQGFRFAITYTSKHDNIPTLYFAASTYDNTKSYMLMTIDGINFEYIEPGIPEGFSTRSMIVHKENLYMSATKTVHEESTPYLYETSNPKLGWKRIIFGKDFAPKGEIESMVSFNDNLYIGIASIGGFSIWRTDDCEPSADDWGLVVDQGAGDALNELPLSMVVFKEKVYVGTGIWSSIKSIDPSKKIVPPKGFDIIEIDKSDNWRIVVGGEPIIKTTPLTGIRNRCSIPSGFGNIFNSYCWQLKVYNDSLFVSSLDSSILFFTILLSLYVQSSLNTTTLKIEDITIEKLHKLTQSENFNYYMQKLKTYIFYLTKRKESKIPSQLKSHINYLLDYKQYNLKALLNPLLNSLSTLPYSFGFDLFSLRSFNKINKISLNGLCNKYNYGCSTLLVSSEKELFIGTANPFQGCEVFKHTN